MRILHWICTYPRVKSTHGNTVGVFRLYAGCKTSIRPVSPLSNSVTAQANTTVAHSEAPKQTESDAAKSKKIGRQLSVNSNGNHYSDAHRQEAERMLNNLNLGCGHLAGRRERKKRGRKRTRTYPVRSSERYDHGAPRSQRKTRLESVKRWAAYH